MPVAVGGVVTLDAHLQSRRRSGSDRRLGGRAGGRDDAHSNVYSGQPKAISDLPINGRNFLDFLRC